MLDVRQLLEILHQLPPNVQVVAEEGRIVFRKYSRGNKDQVIREGYVYAHPKRDTNRSEFDISQFSQNNPVRW